MKALLHKLLIFTLMLTFTINAGAQTAKKATPAKKEMSTADKKKEAERKKKAAEKAKQQRARDKQKAQQQRERDKQKNQQQRERDKQKAQQQRERDKQKAERDKASAERRKETAKRQAERERVQEQQRLEQERYYQDRDKWKQAYLKQEALRSDAEAGKPHTQAKHYINLSARAGYAAMFDNLGAYGNTLTGETFPLMNKSLTGGYGAAFQVGYRLGYGAFRFETGIGFDYLNSLSSYAFQLNRRSTTYPETWQYVTDAMAETRNIGQLTLPLMFGAQFDSYYFMLGARVGYNLLGNYSTRGLYDITVVDDAYINPYGMGIHDIPAPADNKLIFNQPEVRVAAEIGMDFDRFTQPKPEEAQPAKRNAKSKGQPSGYDSRYIHYRLAAFAEYGVLNVNNMSGALPFNFVDNQIHPTSTNSVLALGNGSALNNLFVGLRFAIDFELPDKTILPPPSDGNIRIYDRLTGDSLTDATVQIVTADGAQVVMKPKNIGRKVGVHIDDLIVGNYRVIVARENYYPDTVDFAISEVGSTVNLPVLLTPRPVFRVRVSNADTDKPLASRVFLRQRGTKRVRYTLPTPAATGIARRMLSDSLEYDLHIEQIGYETYDAPVTNIGDSMLVRLIPVKKGEIFIMKNLFFATNKTRILDTSEESLAELYDYLDRTPDVRIRIIGHTDNVGRDEANQQLSEGRANAVRDDLIERGINPDRIEAEGRGESQPIDTNDTEEGRQNNRRVEIEIL